MNQSSSRTEQQVRWQQHITHWQQSGQTQAAFCDAHDLVYHQFTYWRRKFAANPDQATPPRQSGFVAVQRADNNSDTGLTLSLPNGITLRGLSQQHLAWLPQLLERLS